MKIIVHLLDITKSTSVISTSNSDNVQEKNVGEIDFDVNDGFETLSFQIISLFPNISDEFIILDYLGRNVTELDDLHNLSYSQKECLELYCFVPSSLPDPFHYCTSSIPRNSESFDILQTKYDFPDLSCSLCKCCSSLLDPSLLSISQSPEVALALIPFQCQVNKLVEFGLISPERERNVTWPFSKETAETLSLFQVDSPYHLYLKRHFYQLMLNEQKRRLNQFGSTQLQQRQHVLQRINNGIHVIQTYEDPSQQRRALEQIDFPKIQEYFEEEVVKEELSSKTIDEIFFIALLKWFKVDFFKWCNKPLCEHCDVRPPRMEAVGMDQPTYEEKTHGWASRVEVYRCHSCQKITRFPRYNNPAYMMENSRRGRCGEFANVFGLVCKTLGFDVNYVLDFTDHVWVEVWNPILGSYIHIDSCERAYHSPLMYEIGWQKKLSHIISFNSFFIHDSITRYSRDLETVINRRNSEIIAEIEFQNIIIKENQEMEKKYRNKYSNFPPQNDSLSLPDRLRLGKAGFENINVRNQISIDEKLFRAKKDLFDLEQLQFYSQKTAKVEEMKGRISGDLAWRQQRGEIHEKDLNSEAIDSTSAKETNCDISTQLCASDVILPPPPPIPDISKLTQEFELNEEAFQKFFITSFLSNKGKNELSWMYSSQGKFLNGIQLFPTSANNLSTTIQFQCTFFKGFPNFIPNERITSHFSYPQLIQKKIANVLVCNEQISLLLKLFSINFYLFTENGSVSSFQKSLVSMLSPGENIIDYFQIFLPAENNQESSEIKLDSDSQSFKDALHSTRNGVLVLYFHHNQLQLQQSPFLFQFVEQFILPSHQNSWKMDKEGFMFFNISNGSIKNHQQPDNPPVILFPSLTKLTTIKNKISHSINSNLFQLSYQFSSHIMNSSSLPFSVPIVKFHLINDFLPKSISDIWFPGRMPTLQNLSNEKILTRAKEKCLSNLNLIGYSVIYQNLNNNVTNQNASGIKKIEMIWFISNNNHHSGLPLIYSPINCMTFLKKIEKMSSSIVSTDSSLSMPSLSRDVLSYYFVGGGNHGDTIPFNQMENIPPYSHVREISCFAGDSLVNGVQLKYDIPYVSSQGRTIIPFSSNIFTSTEGNPQKRSFIINSSARLASINFHCGALIDRIELAPSNKDLSSFVVGGHGGERIEISFTNHQKEVMGFFGGTGGHLHNLGIVLRELPLYKDDLSVNSSIVPLEEIPYLELLLEIVQELEVNETTIYFHSIPMFHAVNYSWNQCDDLRHNQLFSLIDVSRKFLSLANESSLPAEGKEMIRKALEMILLYFRNIIQHPTEEKYQKINFFNDSFLQRVLFFPSQQQQEEEDTASPSSSLSWKNEEVLSSFFFFLSFGPAAFSFDTPAALNGIWSLTSRFSELYGNNDQKLLVLQSLEKYCSFLERLLLLIH